MKFISLLLFSFLLISCLKTPNNFKYEKSFLLGLEVAKKTNKPVFLYFSAYEAMGYDEFFNDLITSKKIREKLDENFVSIILYVDDKQAIIEADTLNIRQLKLSKNGLNQLKKVTQKGHVNILLETIFFETNSQPLYVILNPQKEILVQPFGYTRKNRAFFLSKLEEGINNFRN